MMWLSAMRLVPGLMSTKTDVVVIGAGPVGLFSVFELGLQGISCHVLDSLPAAGGQCTELYPDKPIYDIPAIPVCTGQELVERLIEQASPFSPVYHFNSEVTVLQKLESGEFLVETAGQSITCRAVLIAAGAGSFTPVRVRVDGIAAYENSQLFYRVTDPTQHHGKHLIVLGGGDSALDWSLALAEHAASLTLVNRTERFRAVDASVEALRNLESEGKVTIHFGAASGFTENNGQLSELKITLREDKSEITLPLDHLLVFFGLSPKLGPVESWGLDFERRLVAVNMSTFETSTPGIYAIGDINTYAGKKKLILSGFHEAALAAFAIKSQFEPDAKVHVQYTTTSSVLQERLGVDQKQ